VTVSLRAAGGVLVAAAAAGWFGYRLGLHEVPSEGQVQRGSVADGGAARRTGATGATGARRRDVLAPIRARPPRQGPRPPGDDEPFRSLLRDQPALAWNAIRPLQAEASARRFEAGCLAATATQLELRFEVSTTPEELAASLSGVETTIEGQPPDEDLLRCIGHALDGAWVVPADPGRPFPPYEGPLFVPLPVPARSRVDAREH
jgi:hypothetical protein